MFKNIILLVSLVFLATSCADTWGSVKRGLTGEKANSTDEFLVKKKDPLILPPNYENLPTPSERGAAKEEVYNLEKKLKKTSSTENNSSSSSSAEQSILKQIREQ